MPKSKRPEKHKRMCWTFDYKDGYSFGTSTQDPCNLKCSNVSHKAS